MSQYRVCMRLVLVGIGLLGLGNSGQSASPRLTWQQSLGGASNEVMFSLLSTGDGGLLLAGSSNSGASGTKTDPGYGAEDYWAIRLGPNGQPVWDRCYGGNNEDLLRQALPMPGGGFLLGGTSLSETNGNKQSRNYGLRDYWIVRVDENGNKLWDRTFGGTSSDYLQDMTSTPDGGCLLAGYSFSGADGSKTSPAYGLLDYWIVKLDAHGNALWDRSYGGNSSDYLTRVAVATNGVLALAGRSFSDISGNRTVPQIGKDDFWFLLVDTNGTRFFEQAFGGPESEVLLALGRTRDGGYLLGGSSASGPSGNKTSPHYGADDFWLVRLDAAGSKLWDRSYGGNGQDVLWALAELDDGRLMLGGWSDSAPGGTKTSWAYGKSDFWLVATDASGQILWDQTYGGSDDEVILTILPAQEDTLLLGGYSTSLTDGCKSAPPFGQSDFWLLNISELGGTTPASPWLVAAAQSWAEVRRDGFRFLLWGETNRCYQLEYSENLSLWMPFATNLLQHSPLQIIDAGATNLEQRFYRALVLP